MSEQFDSVTEWLRQTEAGQEAAVAHLWERYFERVSAEARRRWVSGASALVDAEDLAMMVLTSFFQGVRTGRIGTVQNREHLWRLLEMMMRRQSVDLLRRSQAVKRVGWGQASSEGRPIPASVSVDQLVDPHLTPDLAAQLADELQQLMDRLPGEDLRAIVLAKLAGHTHQEIALQLGKSPSAVDRKLRLIRMVWMRESQP